MIRDRSEELRAFHARHFAEPVNERLVSTNGHHGELTDEDVIRLARSAKNAAKFEALQSGDTHGYASHSEADQAYISLLAFYTQDEEQLDRLYRQSGLCREKWINRPGYRHSTIEKALSGLTETYTPDDGARMVVGNGSKIYSSAPRDEVADERILRFKTARELAKETPAVTEWVVQPWVAKGAITEVDGKIKAGGKTTWVTHMAGKILDGEPFMGEPTTRTKAIFLTEQPPASFRKALERAHLLDREDLLILHWHDTRGVTWHDVSRAVVEKATEVGAGILFVDTLGPFAGIRGDGENNAGAAQEAMRPLQEAAARGLAVVLTRHERKGGGEVGESGRGSSAFGGAVDVILSIRRGEGNTRPTVRIIESLSRFDETPNKLVIELTEGGYRSLGDVTAFAEQEAMKAIVELLPATEENAIETGKVLDKLKEQNIKRTVATDALARLTSAGTIRRVGKGQRGSPYRYLKPTTDDEKVSSETQGEADE